VQVIGVPFMHARTTRCGGLCHGPSQRLPHTTGRLGWRRSLSGQGVGLIHYTRGH
jgi:hypothetical protein